MATKQPSQMSDLFGAPVREKKSGKLCGRFVIPPFTVLDARQGWWQRRKRMWTGLGIQSEVGRDVVPGGGGPNSAMHHSTGKYGEGKQAKTYNSGGPGTLSKGFKQKLAPGGGGGGCWLGGKHTSTAEEYNVKTPEGSGTSIFDPVICELVYRWFCPEGGQVVDPFAGGSVRGIVAHMLGLKYWGCDLRQVQIDANLKQGADICGTDMPCWACGDSNDKLQYAPKCDLVFSCPPYGDLEKYSDDEADLSNMSAEAFGEAYKAIIARACGLLKDDRFAVFVVGDYRCPKRGHLRNFVAKTTAAFRAAGMRLWNDAVLVTAVGSLPIRVSKQFDNSRKMGRTHQHVMVYVKGDGEAAAAACGAINAGWK